VYGCLLPSSEPESGPGHSDCIRCCAPASALADGIVKCWTRVQSVVTCFWRADADAWHPGCAQVGGSFGAAAGLVLMENLPVEWNIQPGIYAIVGATAMLGGVFRSSISLVRPCWPPACRLSPGKLWKDLLRAVLTQRQQGICFIYSSDLQHKPSAPIGFSNLGSLRSEWSTACCKQCALRTYGKCLHICRWSLWWRARGASTSCSAS